MNENVVTPSLMECKRYGQKSIFVDLSKVYAIDIYHKKAYINGGYIPFDDEQSAQVAADTFVNYLKLRDTADGLTTRQNGCERKDANKTRK